MKQAGLMLVAALALLGALALKGAPIALPAPSDRIEAGRFNADRAAARLARILGDQRPHPVDSDAGDAVRARLIAEMRAVGLEPRVGDDFACNSFGDNRNVSCARVRNLVATIGGPGGRHLLLVSHYDSTPAGPGAADDGIGVAAMLEIAEALRGLRLARPITFLINEGEETGLLGARAFLAHDPVVGRVDRAVNLEARGVTGPAIMFETSRPNGPAIDWYRAAARRPVANSLSTDLYRLIPNSTDVAVFEERPWTILNVAVIGNETRYHSAGDDLAALDRRSLQHMGDQALGAALAVAAGGSGPPAGAGDQLYMDVPLLGLIVLPQTLGLVLLGILAIFFLAEAWRRRALGRPLLAMAAAVGGAGAVAFAGHFLLSLLRAGDYWRAFPLVTTTAVYASALAAAVAALLLVAGTAERGRLRAAFWLLLVALGGAICLVAPGAAVYFLLPPFVAAVGMARKWRSGWVERAAAVAAAILLFLTLGPALGLFETLMNADPQWIFAPLGAALLLPALIELRPLLSRVPTAFAVAGAFDLAVAGWLAAGLTPAYSDERRQLFTIEYVWDEAARAGRFAVNNDGAPVPYEAAWERTEMPYTMRRRWAAPAPPAPLAAPRATLVAEARRGDTRRLRLRLAANGAESIALIAPAGARLRSAGTGAFLRRFGRGGAEAKYVLRCAGRACDGAELDIVAGAPGPIDFTIVGTRAGLPAVAAPLVRARPATAQAQYGPDATIAIGRIRL
jgi:peptidase M28-like protein